jgi:hypothetical protein
VKRGRGDEMRGERERERGREEEISTEYGRWEISVFRKRRTCFRDGSNRW